MIHIQLTITKERNILFQLHRQNFSNHSKMRIDQDPTSSFRYTNNLHVFLKLAQLRNRHMPHSTSSSTQPNNALPIRYFYNITK